VETGRPVLAGGQLTIKTAILSRAKHPAARPRRL